MRRLKRLVSSLVRGPADARPAPTRPPRASADDRDTDFRLLAENSGDVICRIDRHLMPVYVSPSVERVLGWTPEEMILGGPGFIHAGDLALVAAAHERLMAGEEEVTKVSFRLMRKDASAVWVEASARAVRGADGAPEGVVIVMRDVSDRVRLEEELRTMSLTDGLTGLCNRRAFDEGLEREWLRTARAGLQMSLLLLDIDNFKKFNDLYGHQAGDDCLRVVAAAVRGALRRPGDMAARYGGEELAVILPETDAEGALAVAETARAAIEALAVHHAGNTDAARVVTASIGAATAFARAGATMKMPEGLLLAADGALYKAKRNGRNRVESAILLAARYDTAGHAP
jgi:diguanylate cyclase (GGDEF)-like protein/PAS domain S-box-containing protein